MDDRGNPREIAEFIPSEIASASPRNDGWKKGSQRQKRRAAMTVFLPLPYGERGTHPEDGSGVRGYNGFSPSPTPSRQGRGK